jgi:hypothetical protein
MGNEADALRAERVAVVTGAAGAMGYESPNGCMPMR